jgi:hypothetical protein
VLLKKYERKTANHLFWAPTGQFVVLAGLRSMNGCLEFVDTGDFTTMGTGEHFMCTDVEWDPTGRSVAVSRIRCLFDSWIRIRDEQPGSYFQELETPCFWAKILKFFDAGPGSGMEIIRIQDRKNLDPGSWINIPDPQYQTAKVASVTDPE